MKNILLLLTICFFFSCENEAKDNRLDWVQEIDKTIEFYDKNAKVEFAKTENHPKFKGGNVIEIYKKDKNNVYKIVVKNDVLDFESQNEIFLKDDKIIRSKKMGYYISNEKKEGLFLIDSTIYFLNKKESIVYEKKLQLSSFEKDAQIKKFDLLPINKSKIEISRSIYIYNSLIENIKKIK